MLDSFTDVILVPANAMSSEGVTERRGVFGAVPPDAGYVFDLILCHGGVEVADARIQVDEAI